MNEIEKLDLKTLMLVEGHNCYDTDYFDSDNYKKLRRTMLENF